MVQPGFRSLRLLAATLPLLALLGDVLAALQGEAFWRDGAALALGLGVLATLGDLRARTRRVGALLASGCMAASLGIQVFAPVHPALGLALGTGLASAAVASLLLSGALLEELARPGPTLLAALELQADELAADLRPGQARRAS
ncbi:MAG: hypothetical protein HY690_19140 [Chloroflexi bacterium]|nr:hypothetical protein [Chloroflexota bacterium]